MCCICSFKFISSLHTQLQVLVSYIGLGRGGGVGDNVGGVGDTCMLEGDVNVCGDCELLIEL